MPLLQIASMIGMVVTLAACGEGGTGGTGFDPPATPRTSTKVVSIGAITTAQDAAITIDGASFALQNTAIFMNDNASNANALKPGMVVRVESTKYDLGEVVVDAVRAWNMVAGRISDNKNSVLTVNGQIVQVTRDTVLDGVLKASDLQIGLHISVLGFIGANGNFIATRIQSLPVDGAEWVAGLMQVVDFRTLAIGDTLVDISSMKSLPTLANGRYVMVRGKMDKVNKKRMLAFQIFSGFADTADDAVEMEGVVHSAFDKTFRLWGRDIAFDPATSVVEGGQWTDVARATHVHVWGRSVGGNLFAEKVRIDPPGAAADTALPRTQSRVVSMITAYDANANSFHVLGLPNTTLLIDDQTIFVGWDTPNVQLNNSIRAYLEPTNNQGWRVTRLALLEKGLTDDVEIYGQLTADVTRDTSVTPNKAYVAIYNDQLNITPVCNKVFGDGENATCLILGDTLPVKDDWVKLQGTYLPITNRRLTWINLDIL